MIDFNRIFSSYLHITGQSFASRCPCAVPIVGLTMLVQLVINLLSDRQQSS